MHKKKFLAYTIRPKHLIRNFLSLRPRKCDKISYRYLVSWNQKIVCSDKTHDSMHKMPFKPLLFLRLYYFELNGICEISWGALRLNFYLSATFVEKKSQ